jgi:predicted glycosyltransferase
MRSISAEGRNGIARVWIDIDYPPQAQYLTPFKQAFEQRGIDVLVTARDVGATYDLLEEAGVPFQAIGGTFGRSKWRKAIGTIIRARMLVAHARRQGVPGLLISPGRSAILAARRLSIPTFAILDYEHVHMGVYRAAKSVIFFPDVIDPNAFVSQGLDRRQLVPFAGLKEDISFSAIDAETVRRHVFNCIPDRVVRVLVRPPTEESHYYRSASRDLTLAALAYLSTKEDVVVVLSPRHPWQAGDLDRFEWRNRPIVIDRPVHFVSLLKAVDLVIACGGTMLREAAYLGVPAYTLFQGRIGQVDRYLERIGKIEVLAEIGDFARLELRRRGRPLHAPPRSTLVADIVDTMLERAREV